MLSATVLKTALGPAKLGRRLFANIRLLRHSADLVGLRQGPALPARASRCKDLAFDINIMAS